jgi:hypothetical protein
MEFHCTLVRRFRVRVRVLCSTYVLKVRVLVLEYVQYVLEYEYVLEYDNIKPITTSNTGTQVLGSKTSLATD